MIDIIVCGEGLSRTGGRYCGYEGPSSGQRLGVAHLNSPKHVAGHPRHREPIAVRIRTGWCGLAHGNLIFPRRMGTTQPALNLARLKAAGKPVFTRTYDANHLRENAVSDRSDSLELSCVSRFHGRTSIMDRIAACAEKVSQRNVK